MAAMIAGLAEGAPILLTVEGTPVRLVKMRGEGIRPAGREARRFWEALRARRGERVRSPGSRARTRIRSRGCCRSGRARRMRRPMIGCERRTMSALPAASIGHSIRPGASERGFLR